MADEAGNFDWAEQPRAEYHLFLAPVVVGGGSQAVPDGVRVKLELIDERRFDSGVVHLHYRTRT